MKIPRWLLVALLAVVIFGALTAKAQDDEDEESIPSSANRGSESSQSQPSEDEDVNTADEDEDGANSDEGATEEAPGGQIGLGARAFFPKHDALRFPAGQKVPTVVAMFNPKAGADSLHIIYCSAHISPLGDTSRFVQNFTGNLYEREIQEKETSTMKYSFTPDAMVEPMDYTLVVQVYFRNKDNNTYAIAAFNDTITITEPLGTDFKGIFTVVGFFGVIGGAIYYFMFVKKRRSGRAKSSGVSSANKDPNAIDEAYIPADHRAFVLAQEAKKRSRSHSGGK